MVKMTVKFGKKTTQSEAALQVDKLNFRGWLIAAELQDATWFSLLVPRDSSRRPLAVRL
jgi:hypothetical protein